MYQGPPKKLDNNSEIPLNQKLSWKDALEKHAPDNLHELYVANMEAENAYMKAVGLFGDQKVDQVTINDLKKKWRDAFNAHQNALEPANEDFFKTNFPGAAKIFSTMKDSLTLFNFPLSGDLRNDVIKLAEVIGANGAILEMTINKTPQQTLDTFEAFSDACLASNDKDKLELKIKINFLKDKIKEIRNFYNL